MSMKIVFLFLPFSLQKTYIDSTHLFFELKKNPKNFI